MSLRTTAPFLPSNQRIVLAAAGAALGEFDHQFVEQLRHPVVDVLRAVVGMKTHDLEGKLMQYGFQYRNQKLFADLADAAHDLPLRHRIHRVDVVHALGSIPVPLMHRVDAQEPRTALRVWLASLAYRHRARPRRLEHGSVLADRKSRRLNSSH